MSMFQKHVEVFGQAPKCGDCALYDVNTCRLMPVVRLNLEYSSDWQPQEYPSTNEWANCGQWCPTLDKWQEMQNAS